MGMETWGGVGPKKPYGIFVNYLLPVLRLEGVYAVFLPPFIGVRQAKQSIPETGSRGSKFGLL